ncbi:MAG TPA: lysyl oxidase family protein [Pyrinomonadaceae bacterium]|nr:lysyl oxidase family protein [Pyrinomonadaceae bacterium]
MRKLSASLITIISLLILGTPSALSQRTSVGRQFPVYDNGGEPDLTVDPQRFTSQMEIVDRLFEEGTCAIEEGAVGGIGYRRILRFDTVVMNGGDGDLIVGDRSDPNNPYHDFFVFAPCHGHYHIRDFSVYELLDTSGTTLVAGHKQGFCFEDSFKYFGNKSSGYSCAFQGITSGWGDWYYKQLTGQWIDITGVPEGDYIVRVTVNLIGIFDEGENRYPNVVQTSIHVPSPRKKVAIDNSPALVDY